MGKNVLCDTETVKDEPEPEPGQVNRIIMDKNIKPCIKLQDVAPKINISSDYIYKYCFRAIEYRKFCASLNNTKIEKF